jgi:hypothetical protein
MGKIFLCIVLLFFKVQVSFAATLDLKKYFENFSTKSAQVMARTLWPQTYQRESREWRQLAYACEAAPTVIEDSQKIERRIAGEPAGPLKNGELRATLERYEDKKIMESAKNLNANLLRKFELNYNQLQRLIAYEKSWSRNAFDMFAISKVDHMVRETGADVRAAIERRQYKRCSQVIFELIGTSERGS